jgi:hypothetical protein
MITWLNLQLTTCSHHLRTAVERSCFLEAPLSVLGQDVRHPTQEHGLPQLRKCVQST